MFEHQLSQRDGVMVGRGGIRSTRKIGTGRRLLASVCATLATVTSVGVVLSATQSPAGAAPTWTAESSNVTASLNAVSFANNSDGLGVGNGGAIVATSTGGDNWAVETSGTTQDLTGVSLVNKNDGWAVGLHGVILATTDGGVTWTAQTSGTTEDLNAVSFDNASDGWAVGNAGTILATVNGGSTWTDQSVGGNDLNGVIADPGNSSIATAVGAVGTIWNTQSGGSPWTSVVSGTTVDLGAVTSSAADSSFQWISGDFGTIMFSSDAGESWGFQNSGTANALYGIAAAPNDPNFVWAVGSGGTIVATTDGGSTTWSPEGAATSDLNGVSAGDSTDAWTLGASGTALNYSSAGQATHFKLSIPSNVVAGQPFNFTVTALDQSGNVATGYSGTVEFPGFGGAVAPTPATLTDGVGTFTATYDTAGNQFLYAQDSADQAIDGFGFFTVGSGAATQLVLSGEPSSVQAGTPFTLTVTALDAEGNTATGYLGTVTFSSSPTAEPLPNNIQLQNGVGTVNVDLTAASAAPGLKIKATDINDATITGTTAYIVVTAAPATHFAVVLANSPVATGIGDPLTITAEDQFGNTVTTYGGTADLTSTDHLADLAPSVSLVNGTASIAPEFETVGDQTITATDSVTSSITGTSNSVDVVAGATDFFNVSLPANVVAGVPFQVTVTAEDFYGNPDPSYSGTVDFFDSSDPLAVLPAPATLTNGVGIFTVTLKTAGSQFISVEDAVHNTITGDGDTNVEPGPVTHFSVAIPPTAGPFLIYSVGVTLPTTVTALDAYGNTVSSGPNDFNGLVDFTSTAPKTVLPPPTALQNGVATFSSAHIPNNVAPTIDSAGTYTIGVADALTGSVTGTSANIIEVVLPDTETHLVMSGEPATVQSGVPFDVTVTAEDAYGNPVGTDAVSVATTDPLVHAPYTGTLASGATTIPITLYTDGAQTLTATDTTDGGVTGATSTAIVVTSGPATQLVLTTPSDATAGSPILFTVTAEDASGNTVTGYGGTVHFTSTDSHADLPANTQLTNGVGTFTATLNTSGTQEITAKDTVTSSIDGTSPGIDVSPGPATHLVLTATTPEAAGTADPVTVTAEDAADNVATSYTGTVDFSSSDPDATLPSPTALVAGTATVDVTFGNAGPQTVTATDSVTSSISGSTSVTVTPVFTGDKLVLTAPSGETAGTSFTVDVTAENQFGNVDTAYNGTDNLAIVGAPTVVGTIPSSITLVNGEGSFSVTIDTAGSQVVTATDSVINSITGSVGIVISPAPATQLQVGATSPQTAGTPFSFAVTALDQYNNVATAPLGSIKFTSDDSEAVLPANSALVNGEGTFTATLFRAGASETITATDTLNSSVTGTRSLTVNAAGIDTLIVSAPSGARAGDSFAFSVTAYDKYGNVAKTFGNDVSFTSSDGQATLPANSTLTNGTKSFSATLKTSGDQTITATDVNNHSISGTATVLVRSRYISDYVLSVPGSVTAGVPFTVTVTAEDQYGNVVTYGGPPVTFTSTDPQAVLPASLHLTDGVGTAMVTLETAGLQTITANGDPVHVVFTGTSPAILVNPANAATFTLTAPGTVQAGVPFNFTVTAYDQFGNVATGYSDFVHILSSDFNATLPNNVYMNGGVDHLSATLESVGSQQLSATDAINSSITGFTNITVTAGPAVKFTVTAPPTAVSGTPFSLTVTAWDQFGNQATGYAGTVHFTTSDPLAVLPANGTLTNGTKSFTATLSTDGNQSIWAADTVNASITGGASVLVYPPPVTGYDLAGADGGVFSFGGDPFEGSMGGKALNQPVVGIATTPDALGYWLVARDGGIFSFGDAKFHGSTGAIHLNKPIVGIARTPNGAGYWLVASDGGVFSFGNAQFYGSTGGIKLNKPIVGIAATPDGGGYWLVASDGGIFAFGDAKYFGSMGSQVLNQPIVAIATTYNGGGYWLVARDGGVFTFGNATFYGSLPQINFAVNLQQQANISDAVGIAPTSDLGGYWIVEADGTVHAFGDASEFGPPTGSSTGWAPDDIVGVSTGPSIKEAI